ncbi:MAG: hypothetical protein FWB77_02695 [Treponema sp.]|nr:hypothetical protein [Treponema sp.]
MTLSERNTFFKIGIAFCAVCTLAVLGASFLTISIYPEMDKSIRRPAGFFHFITGFMDNNYLAVNVSLAALVLFSLIGLILIHFYFERTSAPEILYIAIFAVSFSFEAIRLILPLQIIFNFSSFYVLIASRLLLFARFLSIFSLFAAGLCAAGMEIQKTRNVIFVMIIAALIVVMGVPIDVLNWDSSFNMVNGYSSLFRVIELIAFLTIMISFVIAAKIRGTKEYHYAAIGILLALAGRHVLLTADTWVGPVLGILLLSVGTGLLCSKLHKIHLWL